MKKLLTTIAMIMAATSGTVLAQQDPQFTQFMYNKLLFNAGYAGTSGGVCGNLQYRQQWASFDGAPQSIALGADMALKTLPIGVGLTVITDKIGPMSTTFLRAAGSYHLKVGPGKLGLGLDIGMVQKSITSDWIVPEPLKNDPSIPGTGPSFDNPDLNKATFDLGFGAFYQIPGELYIGFSSTHLPAQSIKEGDLEYKLSRHYYLMGGYTFKLNPWSKLTPQFMMRSDISATNVDINLTYLWSDMIWVGGTYRTGANVPAILAGFQGKAGYANTIGYKIGFSYDLNTAETNSYFGPSYEILLGVCYTPTIKKETSYGNERYLD